MIFMDDVVYKKPFQNHRAEGLECSINPHPSPLPVGEGTIEITSNKTASKSFPAIHSQPAKCRSWQTALAQSIRDPAELCRLAGLPSAVADEAKRAGEDFPLLVPRPFLARVQPGDPDDPLLAQVLPRRAESAVNPGFSADPLGESQSVKCSNLLSKYNGRSLMLTTGRCAVHCRFCFRRHFPFESAAETLAQWEPALDQIAAASSVNEIILSGGDPLTLPDELLAQLADRLAQIPHISRLRIHTRLPAVIPQRVTDELLAWLRGTRLTTIVVIHINHPAEIDSDVAEALGRLIDSGVPVLSQSVLLKGVNDRLDVLMALFQRLVDLRVMPYYLHQLDAVSGAAHFEVPEQEGVELIGRLRARLPGYAVPRYVRELPGRTSKQVLA
jgi:L-lysine 2,3-aminomutase